jgi:hypothetical protein
MRILENLQKYIPFGYLYLIIMGILQESVFYTQIGINILHYSTIADILISPIATLTTQPLVILIAIGLSYLAYKMLFFLIKRRQNKWVQKTILKDKEHLNDVEVIEYFIKKFATFLALGICGLFIGLGLGLGGNLSEKIASNKLEFNCKLNFNSGGAEEIYLIGTNSLYYFYLTKENKNVKIVPIGGIKNIELLDKKTLKLTKKK